MCRARTFALLFSTLCLMAIGLAVASPANSEPTRTPTPTALPPQSLFMEDTCLPPCWFGLVPGETSAGDVTTTLAAHDDLFSEVYETDSSIFDSKTGDMIEGGYYFSWSSEAFLREDTTYKSNVLVIRQGVVDTVGASMNRTVTLEQALALVGQPDAILLMQEGQYWIMALYYPRLPSVVTLTTIRDECEIQQIGEQFKVSEVSYYSADTELNPRVGDYEGTERFIPLAKWQAWLSGEEEVSCEEAFQDLPLPPTPTPTQAAS